MERREFLARSATAVSASLLLGSVRSDYYRFVGSALAAGEGDRQKATLEQKFAEFALSIKYEALPDDVIASAKRVLLDTFGCAFGSVGSEPANIASQDFRGGQYSHSDRLSAICYRRRRAIRQWRPRSLPRPERYLYWHRTPSSERGAADGDCSLRGEWTIRPRTHRSDSRGL
jgi:hypothetical protein